MLAVKRRFSRSAKILLNTRKAETIYFPFRWKIAKWKDHLLPITSTAQSLKLWVPTNYTMLQPQASSIFRDLISIEPSNHFFIKPAVEPETKKYTILLMIPIFFLYFTRTYRSIKPKAHWVKAAIKSKLIFKKSCRNFRF